MLRLQQQRAELSGEGVSWIACGLWIADAAVPHIAAARGSGGGRGARSALGGRRRPLVRRVRGWFTGTPLVSHCQSVGGGGMLGFHVSSLSHPCSAFLSVFSRFFDGAKKRVTDGA